MGLAGIQRRRHHHRVHGDRLTGRRHLHESGHQPVHGDRSHGRRDHTFTVTATNSAGVFCGFGTVQSSHCRARPDSDPDGDTHPSRDRYVRPTDYPTYVDSTTSDTLARTGAFDIKAFVLAGVGSIAVGTPLLTLTPPTTPRAAREQVTFNQTICARPRHNCRSTPKLPTRRRPTPAPGTECSEADRRSPAVARRCTPPWTCARARVVDVVTQALEEHAAGTSEMRPKIGVHPTDTHPANFIHAMPGYLQQMDACVLKWVGGFSKNRDVDLPTVTGVQIYNDTATGVPLAIMECAYLTGLRTAAVSAIAARESAREDAAVLGLVGCGFEGGKHVRYLTEQIPSLRTVRLFDIRPEATQALAAEVAEYFDGEIICCRSRRPAWMARTPICTCTDGSAQVVANAWFPAGAVAVGIEGAALSPPEALHSAGQVRCGRRGTRRVL